METYQTFIVSPTSLSHMNTNKIHWHNVSFYTPLQIVCNAASRYLKPKKNTVKKLVVNHTVKLWLEICWCNVVRLTDSFKPIYWASTTM